MSEPSVTIWDAAPELAISEGELRQAAADREHREGTGHELSGFHSHFKAVTNMSPLQFQKHIRLQEARRLMLGENLDAAERVFGSATTTPRTSTANTSGTSASRRCATLSCCGSWRRHDPAVFAQ
jgi:hypothetical protein